MSADVSGFTRLSEVLAKKGPEGAEELSAALNQYFEKLVALIQEHGGDIIRFAGDSALVLFSAQGDHLTLATREAVRCGLALQKALHGYRTEAGLTLSMRVFVTCGRGLTMIVGGVNGRWEFLVGGAPFEQLRGAPQSEPGHVVVSGAAWTEIAEAAEGTPFRDSTVVVTRLTSEETPKITAQATAEAPTQLGAGLLPLSSAVMSAFVPRSVLLAIEMGDTTWLAEVRRVTIAFARIHGLGIRSESALTTRVNAAFRALQSVVYRYEGSVNQFLFDDKGLVLLSAWGIPSRTHEDDPSRALQAMLEADAAMHELGLELSAGVTTGRAFCGHRGSAARREYAIIGDSVNLAARLMSAARKRRD
jgi:class 3 adenylate cyclase